MKAKFDMANATVNFAAAVDHMGKLTGLDRRKIVMAEAGSVLKKAFTQTPKAPSQKTLELGGRLKALKSLGFSTGKRGVSITAGARGTQYGKVWSIQNGKVRQSHKANFSPLPRHFSDDQWAKISAAINDAKITIGRVVPEVKASAGLARQSWVLIADSLGITLESVPGGGASAGAISSSRGARARGNRQTRNGTSRVDQDATHFAVTLINRLPYGNKLGFQRTLDAAIAGRAAYMRTAILKGFAGSVEEVASRFPGWTVRGGSN